MTMTNALENVDRCRIPGRLNVGLSLVVAATLTTLLWAAGQGLGLDPQYPDAAVLEFQGGSDSRFWLVPPEPERRPYLITSLLELMGGWRTSFAWRHLGSWPGPAVIDPRRINDRRAIEVPPSVVIEQVTADGEAAYGDGSSRRETALSQTNPAKAYGTGAPSPRLHHPLMVKTPKIAPDTLLAAERIGRQLNQGVSGIVFVGVESAAELKAGLAAMRFRSQGGTRPDDVGQAPALWGMSEREYREKADLWPLNPNGELVAWAIVESKEGLARVREIAAVKGVGALFPGAGTLRGVFTTSDAGGQRVFDPAGWEAAIQQVLAACQEFKVPCGYPANASDIEMRMRQGFSVFVINWGEQGFRTVEIGRRAAGR